MEVLKRIQHLEQQLGRLAGQLDQLRAEQASLEKDNKQLRAELKRQRAPQPAPTRHVDSANPTAWHPQSMADYEHLKSQLDTYMEQLDQCMAWLRQQH